MAKFLAYVMTVLTFLSGLFGTNMSIHVNKVIEKQEIDGWGTSACWWSQKIDDPETREYLAKALYSKEGLGLNIYRYNIGGGVNPEHNRVDPNSSRSTESFYYFNEETGKYEYDFTRDANAQAFLDEALKYGCIDTVVLFANSPHYSMTISGEATGSFYGEGTTNLAEEHYQDFVDYFLTITEYFIEKGVPDKYIAPINEPQWDWGGGWVGQEGCHYEPQQVYELIKLFSKGIDDRGLNVKLSVPESGEIGELTNQYFTSLKNDKDIYKNIGSFAYHSYWRDTMPFDKSVFGYWLKDNRFTDKKIEMSEWCELPCSHAVDDVEGAVIMARVIANDLYYTGVNSWSSWVAVNTTGISEDGAKISDAMFYANDDFSQIEMSERYYAMAHFSKFVPAGSKMVMATTNTNPTAKDANGIEYYLTNFAAFKTPDKKTVLVIVNEDDAMKINLGVPALHMTVYTTDENHKLEETYSGRAKTSIKVSHNSITTVVFDSDIDIC